MCAFSGKFKKRRNPNKFDLVFDDEKRREFLTGFRKRKCQRKKNAQEKLQMQLKEEKKRLQLAAKKSYKQLHTPNCSVEDLSNPFHEECEDNDVNVEIMELPTNIQAETKSSTPTVHLSDELHDHVLQTKLQKNSQKQVTLRRGLKKAPKKSHTKKIHNSPFKRNSRLKKLKQSKNALTRKERKNKKLISKNNI